MAGKAEVVEGTADKDARGPDARGQRAPAVDDQHRRGPLACDEAGEVVLGQKGKQKGKPQPDSALRDTENVPLADDIQAYFEREVLPHAPDAWVDEEKSKVGYVRMRATKCT